MNFREKQVYIDEYGFRYDEYGNTFRCGSHPYKPYLRRPKKPNVNHSIVKMLWAIEFATSFLQDAPTRKQVIDICRMSKPMFDVGKFSPGKVDIKRYWTDLYRLHFVNQYRRSYGRGSNKHFDVVYELTESAKYYMMMARENTLLSPNA